MIEGFKEELYIFLKFTKKLKCLYINIKYAKFVKRLNFNEKLVNKSILDLLSFFGQTESL